MKYQTTKTPQFNAAEPVRTPALDELKKHVDKDDTTSFLARVVVEYSACKQALEQRNEQFTNATLGIF